MSHTDTTLYSYLLEKAIAALRAHVTMLKRPRQGTFYGSLSHAFKLLEYDHMSDMSQRLSKIEKDVQQVQSLLMQVLMKLDADRLSEKLKVVVDAMHDVAEEDLYNEAYVLFGISSKEDTDDNLITHPTNVKPIDWSSYAQNRTR